MIDSITALVVTADAVGADGFDTVAEPDEREFLDWLCESPGIEEALVLSTCQRVALYWHGPVPEVERSLPGAGSPTLSSGTTLEGESAVEHLFRVACGLESTVLGEDEILGQLRDARRLALEAGALDGPLEAAVGRAIRAGERARAETKIGEGSISLGSVAADWIEAELGGLAGTTVLVIGAGQMGTLVAKALASRDPDPEIRVANRTVATAQRLAEAVGGRGFPLAEIDEHLSDADAVVTATGADGRLLGVEDLRDLETVVVDLAAPRDVAPAAATLDGVELSTMGDLAAVRHRERQRRQRAVPRVEAIIDEEHTALDREIAGKRADDVLADVFECCEEVRKDELDRALARLRGTDGGLTAEQAAVIEEFSEALVASLMHRPAAELREAARCHDWTTVKAGASILPGSEPDVCESVVPDPETAGERFRNDLATRERVPMEPSDD